MSDRLHTPLDITFYVDKFDNESVCLKMPWEKIAQILLAHEASPCTRAKGPEKCKGKECPYKHHSSVEGQPMAFCPVLIDGPRLDKNVKHFSMLCLDFDHLPDVEAMRVEEVLNDYEHVRYTTHNHRPDDISFRAVLPLARDVAANGWHRFLSAAIEFLSVPADPTCKNRSRLFFRASHPKDTPEGEFGSEWIHGKLLDPDLVLRAVPEKPRTAFSLQQASAASAAPGTVQGLTGTLAHLAPVLPDPLEAASSVKEGDELPEGAPTDMGSLKRYLTEFAARKKRSTERKDKIAAVLLRRVLKGEMLARTSGIGDVETVRVGAKNGYARDEAVHLVACTLACLFPAGTPWEAVAELVRPSIALMFEDVGEDWMAKAEFSYARAEETKAIRDLERKQAAERRLQAVQQMVGVAPPLPTTLKMHTGAASAPEAPFQRPVQTASSTTPASPLTLLPPVTSPSTPAPAPVTSSPSAAPLPASTPSAAPAPAPPPAVATTPLLHLVVAAAAAAPPKLSTIVEEDEGSVDVQEGQGASTEDDSDEAEGEGDDDDAEGDDEAAATAVQEAVQANPDVWKTYLKTKGDGSLVQNTWNARMILENAPEFKGTIRWNMVTKKIEIHGGALQGFAQFGNENIVAGCEDYLQSAWDLNVKYSDLVRRVVAVARANAYDPLADELNSKVWDGTERITTWLHDYLGVEDSEFSRKAGRRWLIGLVARALEPGCKMDYVLVLEGKMGLGKSGAFSILGGKFFSDTPIQINNKDSWMLAGQSWICEMAEIVAFKKHDHDSMKAFVSRQIDKFRLPYGQSVEESPRRCVFVGTTNEDEYLGDLTGNRKYLCCKCHYNPKLFEMLKRDRDQILAEAVAAYRAGEQWHFSYEEISLTEAEANKRVIETPASQKVTEWWFSMLKADRPSDVSTMEVAEAAMGALPAQVTKAQLMEIGHALRSMGFERRREPTGGRQYRYYASEAALAAEPVVRKTMKKGLTALPGGKGQTQQFRPTIPFPDLKAEKAEKTEPKK